MKGALLTVFIWAVVSTTLQAQITTDQSLTFLPTTTPTVFNFLTINPDPGAPTNGIAGENTPSDVFINPGKLTFNRNKFSVAANYLHWNERVDASIGHLGLHRNLSEKHTIGTSLRYLSSYVGLYNQPNAVGLVDAREFAADFAYGYRISKQLGIGVTGRYVHSGLTLNPLWSEERSHANALTADLGLLWENKVEREKGTRTFRAGATISNLGGKVRYEDELQSHYIPSTIGAGFAYVLERESHSFRATVDLNKRLVPSSNFSDTDTNGIDDYLEFSQLEGMIKSFSDSPTGFNGELSEVAYSLGTAYTYNNKFIARLGFSKNYTVASHQKNFTVGCGIKVRSITGNFAFQKPFRNNIFSRDIWRFGIRYDLQAKA